MQIAGIQKLSLVDYPRHLAAVIFLQGCNFRCGYCQNPDLIPPEGTSSFSEEEIIKFISKRKGMIEGVVVTGGEPTIHNDLENLIVKIKETGLKVKLDTNGSDPEKILSFIRRGLIDYIAIDIKTTFPKYSFVSKEKKIQEKVEKSIRLALLSTIPYEFRTTCVPGIVDQKDIEFIAETVKGAKKYCLQQFRPNVTYEEEFKKVKPYSTEEIENFRKILEKKVETVEVRGV